MAQSRTRIIHVYNAKREFLFLAKRMGRANVLLLEQACAESDVRLVQNITYGVLLDADMPGSTIAAACPVCFHLLGDLSLQSEDFESYFSHAMFDLMEYTTGLEGKQQFTSDFLDWWDYTDRNGALLLLRLWCDSFLDGRDEDDAEVNPNSDNENGQEVV